MIIVDSFLDTRRNLGPGSALVPTMGSLHAGHMSLIDLAKTRGDAVVVSLFVNPLQFNDSRDLAKYPRDLDRDAALCEAAGVDVLFVPPSDEMFPVEPLTRVVVGRAAEAMEGRFRPGHFDGVATVVSKLFAGIQPGLAVFGKKDAQQLAVVRTLVRDLSFPVEVVAAPTVRDPDGLALSSRNVFLESDSRMTAVGLSRGLFEAADLIEAGERSAHQLAAAVRSEAGGTIEYVALASQVDASLLGALDRPAFLAVAARVGGVRLIDNIAIDSIDPVSIDRGIVARERI